MTASARHVWDWIAAGYTSFDTLTTMLAADLQRPVDDELTTAIREALASMDRVGLVRPIP